MFINQKCNIFDYNVVLYYPADFWEWTDCETISRELDVPTVTDVHIVTCSTDRIYASKSHVTVYSVIQ